MSLRTVNRAGVVLQTALIAIAVGNAWWDVLPTLAVCLATCVYLATRS